MPRDASSSAPNSTPAGPSPARTQPPLHSTAHRLGKRYRDQWPVSTNPDKRPQRPDDGYVNSHDYARRTRSQRPPATQTGGNHQASQCRFDVEYHHWLEDLLGKYWVRKLLGYLAKPRRNRQTIIEEIIATYGNPQAPLWQRTAYWPFHRAIRRIAGSTPVATFRRRIAEHTSTVRGLVLTARSVAEFGLSVPQRFSAPMFLVWNFTNLCNLRCKHCYQDSAHQRLADELTLEDRLRVADQAGELYIPMIAFAGGEPTIDRDLLPTLRRCQQHGIHTSVATHGGTMTPKLAGQLAEAGVRYVEISLDSVDPERHDAFRGVPGMWQRTVRGMRNVVAQEGLRLGVAMCVHQGNYAEVEDMIRFAVDIGADTFAHFNFIPVGRGLEMTAADLNPRQRERLLLTLNRWMQSGQIGVISTAPQLGKVCLAHAPRDGRTTASHAGSGAGWKARVVAKYLGGCGAARTYFAIEPNGDVTPCVYLPHRVLGNVRHRPLGEITRDNDVWQIASDRKRRLRHCEVCEFKNYCGGCLARADAYYGVLNAGDPGCLFNEKHWEALVRQGIGTDLTPAGAAAADHQTGGAPRADSSPAEACRPRPVVIDSAARTD